MADAQPRLREGLNPPLVDKARRKALVEEFQQAALEAGVYRIVNLRTGRMLLGSSNNLKGLRNRFDFARSTNSPAALDRRLRDGVTEFGFDSLSLEVLDILAVKPDMTSAQVAADLATLEALWCEKLDPSLLY